MLRRLLQSAASFAGASARRRRGQSNFLHVVSWEWSLTSIYAEVSLSSVSPVISRFRLKLSTDFKVSLISRSFVSGSVCMEVTRVGPRNIVYIAECVVLSLLVTLHFQCSSHQEVRVQSSRSCRKKHDAADLQKHSGCSRYRRCPTCRSKTFLDRWSRNLEVYVLSTSLRRQKLKLQTTRNPGSACESDAALHVGLVMVQVTVAFHVSRVAVSERPSRTLVQRAKRGNRGRGD